MSKIINTKNRQLFLASYDEENEEFNVTSLKSKPTGIDTIYVAPENSDLEYTDPKDGKVITKSVKKNDIIITFYRDDFDTPFVVIKSKDWLKAFDNYDEAEQKRKEKWAADRAEVCGDVSCINCDKRLG